MNNPTDFLRIAFAAFGALLAILEPTLPYLALCTVLIFADCLTAWQLAKRAKKAHPNKVGKDGHKFKSHHFGKVFSTLLKAYILIIIAYFIELYITSGLPIDLTKVAAGAICFWQLWSILENESSCNGSRWAKLLQKVLVDKTSRHFDVNLSDLDKFSDQLTTEEK